MCENARARVRNAVEEVGGYDYYEEKRASIESGRDYIKKLNAETDAGTEKESCGILTSVTATPDAIHRPLLFLWWVFCVRAVGGNPPSGTPKTRDGPVKPLFHQFYRDFYRIRAMVGPGIFIGVDFAGVRRGKEHTPMDQYCADRGVQPLKCTLFFDKIRL